MLADAIQDLTPIHETGTIHVQGVDRRSPCWGEAQYLRVVSTPSKMGVPGLLTWVVEWHQRVICRSGAAVRVYLCPLHPAQAKARLSRALLPPRLTGRICSTAKEPVA